MNPTGALQTEWWGPSLFRHGDRPDAPCPPEIDITGRARILVFGPFVPLPAGRWRAAVTFEACAEARRYPYLIEFGTAAGLTERAVPPGAPPERVVEIEHALTAPATVEIRLWVARAAFHGAIRFHGVRFGRMDPHSATPSLAGAGE